MYTLTLSEVTELKTAVKNQFDCVIHFHDCCGGQSFSMENPTEETKKFITAFFAAKKLNVVFSKDGTQFSTEEISSC